MRPGFPVDAGRAERVVHVADGQDPHVERKVGRLGSIRIPGAVEALVVAAHEAIHHGREATQLVEQGFAQFDMSLHLGELRGRQRARLLENPVRNGELADVVQEATDRQVVEPLRGEAELVSYLDGAERDAARVLFRVRVLLRQRDQERSDVRAEEGFLLGDEIGALEIAEQRPRAGCSSP